MKAIICDKCGKVVREKLSFSIQITCNSQRVSKYNNYEELDLCEDCYVKVHNLATENNKKI